MWSILAKGAVLFDGSGNRNYMVHASRRDKAGMAEVHVKDADIIYVLDGSATFVTGGTVVDGKTLREDVPTADSQLPAGDQISVLIAPEANTALPLLRKGAGMERDSMG